MEKSLLHPRQGDGESRREKMEGGMCWGRKRGLLKLQVRGNREDGS